METGCMFRRMVVTPSFALLACTLISLGVSSASTAGNPVASAFKDPYNGGIKLPVDGGEPGHAYMAYMNAVYRKDHRQLCQLMGAQPAEMEQCLGQKEALDGLIALYSQPKSQKVLGGYMRGDEATLDVAYTHKDAPPSNGFAVMNKSNNLWILSRIGGSGSTTVSAEASATVDLASGSSTASIRVEQTPVADYTGISGAASAGVEPAAAEPTGTRTIMFEFDPRTLRVLPEEETGGQVVVVSKDGEEKMLFHNAVSHAEAAKMAAVLKHYKVNEVVEISIPGEIEQIYLKSGQVPSGKYQGEQCTTFDPAALAVTEFKGTYRSETGQEVGYTQWSVDDGKRMVTRYNDKPFAEEMAAILQKYGFTNRCHVGGFWYFRK